MDKPGIFVKRPIEVEAIQFTGKNWLACREFCGTHKNVFFSMPIINFGKIGINLLTAEEDPKNVAELWVAANTQWLPIEVGEWIIKDANGCYPCKDHTFQATYYKKEESS